MNGLKPGYKKILLMDLLLEEQTRDCPRAGKNRDTLSCPNS
jgi:hypothetical protein